MITPNACATSALCSSIFGESVIVSVLPERKFGKRLTIAGGAAADTSTALAEAEPPLLLRERFLTDIECCNSETLTCAQKITFNNFHHARCHAPQVDEGQEEPTAAGNPPPPQFFLETFSHIVFL